MEDLKAECRFEEGNLNIHLSWKGDSSDISEYLISVSTGKTSISEHISVREEMGYVLRNVKRSTDYVISVWQQTFYGVRSAPAEVTCQTRKYIFRRLSFELAVSFAYTFTFASIAAVNVMNIAYALIFYTEFWIREAKFKKSGLRKSLVCENLRFAVRAKFGCEKVCYSRYILWDKSFFFNFHRNINLFVAAVSARSAADVSNQAYWHMPDLGLNLWALHFSEVYLKAICEFWVRIEKTLGKSLRNGKCLAVSEKYGRDAGSVPRNRGSDS